MENAVVKKVNFQPRQYQLYYLQKAKEQNVIICLGTGSGKTFITIMLLKEYAGKIRKDHQRGIFLAPTNPLVIQQADEIRKHTNFSTKAYYGSLGVDIWNEEKWSQEISNHEIMVLTPVVFYQILTKKLIELDQICVIIFDEAHHGGFKRKGGGLTETNHPYKKIMSFIIDERYHNRIRIIGTTASVINACIDSIHLSDCAKEMEKTYNAHILGEFDFDVRYLAEPNILTFVYNEEIRMNDQYEKLFNIYNKLDLIIRENASTDSELVYKMKLNILGYLAEKPTFKPEYIKRMIFNLKEVQKELGLYSALIVCKEFRKELKIELEKANHISSTVKEKNEKLIKLADEFLSTIENIYSKTVDKLKQFSKADLMMNLSSCKMLRLLDIIYCYIEHNPTQFSILIFVNRVLFSFAISKFLEDLSTLERFKSIRSSFFVGNNNEYQNFKFIKESVKNFKTTIQDFKDLKLNILTTTAVLEEGIDIGRLNLVIRFSEAKTYREFVQSKGRARAKDSFFVMLSEDEEKIKSSIKKFDKVEEFLLFKFKQSKSNRFNVPIISDNYEIQHETEHIKTKTGSVMVLHEACPFLTRYLIKKGSKYHEPIYEFENIFNEGFRCKLNLQGVTPLVDEVVGQIYETKDDAFSSACLAACKSLYERNFLNEHFIPISVEEVAKKSNLINRNCSEEEIEELNHIFRTNKQRLMFKKKMGDYEYFKNFITKSTGSYDLYELSFETDDPHLNNGDFKLGLITQLPLTTACKSTTLYSSFYQAKIKLNLIKSILLNDDQNQQIGDFTFTIFKTAIPALKKRTDINFNLEKCLFKFVFLNNQSSIDYNEMMKLIQFNQDQLNEEHLNNKNLLVRAIHTNTDYKLISINTNKYPSDHFMFKDKLITYNDYFRTNYDIEIANQNDQLYKVEHAKLNSLYSIFVPKEEKTDSVASKFDIFLPKELVTISAFTKELYKKLNCLPPLIYRMKQKIILKHFYTCLNHQVLNIETTDFDYESSFFPNQTSSSKIDDFIYQNYLKKNSAVPFFESESSSSSDEESEEQTNDNDNEQMVAERESNLMLNNVRKPFQRKTKNYKFVRPDESIIHPSMKQIFLDEFLNESLDHAMKDCRMGSLNQFINEFNTKFETIIRTNNREINLRNFPDLEPKLKKRKMCESNELKRIDFNCWTYEHSDKILITPFILLQALSTRSANDQVDLERLEFLGDCFLKLITCCLLFYEDLAVGELDIVKTQIVSNKNLYRISREKRLYEFLFADKFLPSVNWLPDGFHYNEPTPNCPDRLVTVIDQNSVYKSVPLKLINRNQFQELKAKGVSDGIESLIGGILNVSGLRNACLFMKYLGVYSDQFKIDLNTEQKHWFSQEKYDPLKDDPYGKLKDFSDHMYINYDFKSLEDEIGYQFKNKALLIQAFKHVSYDDPFPSYEKLEFMGDAVIDYLIMKYFFETNDNLSPGQLTNLKTSLINNAFFGVLSTKFGLSNYLIQKNPTLFDKIKEFKDFYEENVRIKGDDFLIIPNSYLQLEEPTSIDFDSDQEIHKVLGDVFESLIAAIFIDSDFDLNAVWSVLHKFMINELLKFKDNPPKTFIGQMHELYPLARFSNCRFEANQTKIDISVNEKIYTGCGINKKLAKMNASKQIIKDYIQMRNTKRAVSAY